SATPIPRTLYLSLVGVKDMSTIETPPLNRLPVETVVSAYDERIIRDAINRELERQGQVFFLHNRIMTIERARDRIVDLCPQARVEIGHGQMDSDELEAIMAQFVAGKIDVLVCTTIIESGLDIPNANTIIIDRADRFGLADLYQLRGRVGRAEHKAYAYLGPETCVPAFVPSSFIDDATLRIRAYRDIAEITTHEQLDRLRCDWRDRFGPFPPTVDNLFLLAEMKLAAAKSGVSRVEVRDRKLMLTRGRDFILVAGKFPRLVGAKIKQHLREILELIKKL